MVVSKEAKGVGGTMMDVWMRMDGWMGDGRDRDWVPLNDRDYNEKTKE